MLFVQCLLLFGIFLLGFDFCLACLLDFVLCGHHLTFVRYDCMIGKSVEINVFDGKISFLSVFLAEFQVFLLNFLPVCRKECDAGGVDESFVLQVLTKL